MSAYLFVIAGVFGALAVAAGAADRLPARAAPADRYRPLEDHADLGCGADEYRGPRRYTRPSEHPQNTRKTAPGNAAKHSGTAFTIHQFPITQKENR